tara:strand:+ start:665 stop:817 length:153 start_codon:yes stop_codon:yes gene_type:complete
MSNITDPKNISKMQLHEQFSEKGLIVKEDDQDWGSAGMNDIQPETNKVNQ